MAREDCMKIAHLASVLAVALAASPAASLAGPTETKAAAEADASAREHFQRGQRLSAAGDYAAAYREFAAGYVLTERPLFLFNMAEAARASGDVAKARENYAQFLRVDPKNSLAATAQSRIADLDRAAAAAAAAPQLGPQPPPPGTSPGAAVSTSSPGAHADPVLLPATGSPTPTSRAGEPMPASQLTVSHGSEPAPVWKTWPFWTIVGGVVAGSVIVYAVSRDNSTCGAGCSQLNFR